MLVLNNIQSIAGKFYPEKKGAANPSGTFGHENRKETREML